uniref:Uncharacterized protein n=1 Tax=Tanacetum cinerariifolium TaxID=118510 RepID=A0A699HV10_TANCI|nr:hypothetical protein [Tanacetum cinerariifolium]
MSRRSNYKLVTLFFDPERHFHARKNLTQIFVHNIFSFYESDASKLKFEEMGEVDIDTLTMKQYMALTRGNHRPGVVRPEIANNVNFKIKGQFMKELRDNIFFLESHALSVSYNTQWRGKEMEAQIADRMHLVKEYPLKEEVNAVEEAKYGKLGRPFPNNNGNEARYHVGTPGYYNKMETRPPFGERKSSLEETINKYLEEEAKKQTERDEWLGKFQENTDVNLESHDEAIKSVTIAQATTTAVTHNQPSEHVDGVECVDAILVALGI